MSLVFLMLALVAIGFPVSFSLGISSLVFFLDHNLSFITYAQQFAVSLDNFSLMAAPLFILVGELLNGSGITEKIFRFANSIVGHLPGGLGHVNVLASTIFAGMSGTAIADAAGLGPIEIKAMTDNGYDKEFSTAVTAASSIIGPIIPPSTIMVVYGVTAGVSVGALFMGGVIPGIIIALLEMCLVWYYSKKRHYPRNDKFSWKRLFVSLKDSIWALLCPLVIIGGILGGVFTPTEAGAVASLYSLLVSLFAYRSLSLKDLPQILWRTALTSGVVLVIVATASIFGWCLTFAKVPQLVASALSSLTSSKIVMMLILSVIYLFLGCIMEASAIVLTTVPILLPVLKILHIDLVYFGVIVALLMSIGTITPPVGTVLFILSKVTGMSIERITKELLPWYGVLIIVILILIFVPQTITWLPSIVG